MGVPVDIYDMIWLKPLDETLLEEAASKYDHIVTLEDGCRTGGFGSAVSEWLSTRNFPVGLSVMAIADAWMSHASVDCLRRRAGIDADAIVATISNIQSQK